MKNQTQFLRSAVVSCLVGFSSWAAMADTNSVPVDLNRAVQINWPAVDGALYQVYTSTDLTNWIPSGSPLVGIGGVSNSVAYPASNSGGTFFLVDQLPGLATNRFINVTNTVLEGVSATFTSNAMSLSNLRLEGLDHSISDYVTATFSYDTTHQVFRLAKYSISPKIGVYNKPFFVSDNTNGLYLYQTTNNLLTSGVAHSINSSGSPYFMDLTVGQAVSFNLQNATVSYRMTITDPTTNELCNAILSQNEGVLSDAYPILAAGRYLVRFIPYNTQATNVTLTVTFMNANRRSLTTITNGLHVNLNFDQNLRDYAKFQVTLNTNQLLTLPAPSDPNIQFTLLSSNSTVIGEENTGLSLNYQPPVEGTYYLFVYNCFGRRSTYNGTAAITTVTNRPGVILSPSKGNWARIATEQ